MVMSPHLRRVRAVRGVCVLHAGSHLTTEEKARKSLGRDSRKVLAAYDSLCRRGYVVHLSSISL